MKNAHEVPLIDIDERLSWRRSVMNYVAILPLILAISHLLFAIYIWWHVYFGPVVNAPMLPLFLYAVDFPFSSVSFLTFGVLSDGWAWVNLNVCLYFFLLAGTIWFYFIGLLIERGVFLSLCYCSQPKVVKCKFMSAVVLLFGPMLVVYKCGTVPVNDEWVVVAWMGVFGLLLKFRWFW